MRIKIIRSHEEVEFNPSELLESQVRGAKQVIIDYDMNDTKIQSFMDQIDRIIKTGVSCQMNIKVQANNSIMGHKLEKKTKKVSIELDINEAIKTLVSNHSETDRKLEELSEMCMERVNER